MILPCVGKWGKYGLVVVLTDHLSKNSGYDEHELQMLMPLAWHGKKDTIPWGEKKNAK